jgi:hypothetical protein
MFRFLARLATALNASLVLPSKRTPPPLSNSSIAARVSEFGIRTSNGKPPCSTICLRNMVMASEVLTPTLVETGTLIGAVALDQTAVFMKTKIYESTTVTFTATTNGSVKMNYYVGGLAAGTWDVSIGGVSVGSFAVDNTTHFVTFASNATGTVTMTRR